MEGATKMIRELEHILLQGEAKKNQICSATKEKTNGRSYYHPQLSNGRVEKTETDCS